MIPRDLPLMGVGSDIAADPPHDRADLDVRSREVFQKCGGDPLLRQSGDELQRRLRSAGGEVMSRQNESAPEAGALPNFNRSEPQAATLVGLTSRTLLEFAIGIIRGFMASGISRTRSTCRSPFSRLAPLTLT
jgi:hypothetical protein